MTETINIRRRDGDGRAICVSVVGRGDPAPADWKRAEELGRCLAEMGLVVVCGGRDEGVMKAVCDGVTSGHGLSIGLLPGVDRERSSATIRLPTGLSNARNALVAQAGEVVIACGDIGAGTASEVALALKYGRPVILLAPQPEAEAFFTSIGAEKVAVASTIDEVAAALTTWPAL